MGWGDCGDDSKGRPIGYCYEAECDHDGCNKKIDRGLSYACGGTHGEADCYCEKYFCSTHKRLAWSEDGENVLFKQDLCLKCADELEKYHKEEQEPETLKSVLEYMASLTIEDLKNLEDCGSLETWDRWYWVDEDGLPKEAMDVLVCYDWHGEERISTDMFDGKFLECNELKVKAWKPLSDIGSPIRKYRRSVTEPSLDITGENYEWGECMSEKNNQGKEDGPYLNRW